ncbi:rhomboid family intramembrane serine protease [Pseudomonas putida]|uniref:rhomboid family intramembrane serine protease n=1 Tax=Pseudomonas putida TaxID=303 RepID=UPI0023641D28|nr:rhomboid family intramembrane serine protease [Pseudomonas putida]MDD2139753.1 rhomboid family intramembrane serine protease [Pseudomonas putida]HDS1721677.1 rhomboid family intramembrane serine protease [Pseudomonas putida]
MQIGKRVKVVLGFLAVLIVVQVVNTLTGNSLLQYGLFPRTSSGLQGVLFSPFIHGSVRHLLSNLAPLAVLSWLVMSEGVERYIRVAVLIAVISGLLVWCFGRANLHVGASGLIFGLWTYLLARGWYERSLSSVVIAMFVVVFYSGLVFGFIPVPGVSFEGHIAGAVAGVLIGWLMHSRSLAADA